MSVPIEPLLLYSLVITLTHNQSEKTLYICNFALTTFLKWKIKNGHVNVFLTLQIFKLYWGPSFVETMQILNLVLPLSQGKINTLIRQTMHLSSQRSIIIALRCLGKTHPNYFVSFIWLFLASCLFWLCFSVSLSYMIILSKIMTCAQSLSKNSFFGKSLLACGMPEFGKFLMSCLHLPFHKDLQKIQTTLNSIYITKKLINFCLLVNVLLEALEERKFYMKATFRSQL